MLYELNPFNPQPRLLRTCSCERSQKVLLAPFDMREYSGRVNSSSSASISGLDSNSTYPSNNYAQEVEDACEKVWEETRKSLIPNRQENAEVFSDGSDEETALDEKIDVVFCDPSSDYVSVNYFPRDSEEFQRRLVSRAGVSQEAIRRLSSSITDTSLSEIFASETTDDLRDDETAGCRSIYTDAPDSNSNSDKFEDQSSGNTSSTKHRSSLSASTFPIEDKAKGGYYFSQPVTSVSMGGIDFSALLYDDQPDHIEWKHSQSFKTQSTPVEYQDFRMCTTMVKPTRKTSKHGGVPTPRMRDVWKGWARKVQKGEQTNQRMPSVIQSELQFRAEMEQKLAASAARFREVASKQPGCFALLPPKKSLEEGAKPLFLGKFRGLKGKGQKRDQEHSFSKNFGFGLGRHQGRIQDKRVVI